MSNISSVGVNRVRSGSSDNTKHPTRRSSSVIDNITNGLASLHNTVKDSLRGVLTDGEMEGVEGRDCPKIRKKKRRKKKKIYYAPPSQWKVSDFWPPDQWDDKEGELFGLGSGSMPKDRNGIDVTMLSNGGDAMAGTRSRLRVDSISSLDSMVDSMIDSMVDDASNGSGSERGEWGRGGGGGQEERGRVQEPQSDELKVFIVFMYWQCRFVASLLH